MEENPFDFVLELIVTPGLVTQKIYSVGDINE